MKVIVNKINKKTVPVLCLCGKRMVLRYTSTYIDIKYCSRHFSCECGNTYSTMKELNDRQLDFLTRCSETKDEKEKAKISMGQTALF